MDPALDIGGGTPTGAIEGPLPLRERFTWDRYWSRAVNAGLFLTFAVIALVLATIGLYAVIAHSVSRATQEIGIRMAMGATPRDIRSLVLRQGMLPVVTGLGLQSSSPVPALLGIVHRLGYVCGDFDRPHRGSCVCLPDSGTPSDARRPRGSPSA
jgi:hypothetical protein